MQVRLSRIERGLLFAPVVVIAAHLVLPPPARVVLGHVALFLAPATAALLSARAALRGARGAVPTWALLSLAAACVATAQATWAFQQLVLRVPIPFPSPSFYLVLAFHPLFAAGLIASLREGDRTESRREILHDALLACAAIGLGLLRFVFEPLRLSRPWLSYSEASWIVGAQFLAQLSLVAAAMVIVWRRSVLPPRAAAAVVLVALVNGIANLLQIAGLDPDAGTPGDPFDLIWLAGWLLLAAGAAAGASTESSAWTGRTAVWVSRRLRQSIAPLAAAALTVTAVDIGMTGGASWETTAVLGVLGTLVALRLAGALAAADREQQNQHELVRTRVLVELSRTLAAAPRAEDALKHVADAAIKLLGGRRVWLERLEPDGTVRITAARPATAEVRVPGDRSCGRWLGPRRVAQCLTGEELYALGPDGLRLPPRAWLAVAAVRFGDHLTGSLVVERYDLGFDAAELELLGALADQAAIAIENARLIVEARDAERTRLRNEKLTGLGQLAAGVAHEINNPLTAIHSAATMLASETPHGENAATVEIIRSEAARAATIVRGMLDFVRPPELSVRPVDLADLVRSLIRARSGEHGRLGIRTHLEMDGLPPVLADRGPVVQVFLNLIGNAEDALQDSPDDRVLIVAGRATDAAVFVDVHDTGAGIPAENLGRVFDPFFTTKPVGKGTGLGLSVSYGIMRELGGAITVESTPGQGTTFTLRLPRAPDLPPPRTPPAATPVSTPVRTPPPVSTRTAASGADTVAPPAAAVPPTRPLDILLVDDEPSIRAVVSRFLRRRGHHVQTAENGRAALDLLRTRRFEVILTDLKMPEMDGEALFDQLNRIDPQLAARVLFVSGDTVAGSTRDFLLRTGRPFISKPFALDELADMVVRVGAGDGSTA